MDAKTLLVTIPTEPEHRRTIEAGVPAGVDCIYVEDVDADERSEVIRSADALLSRLPHQELDDEELGLLRAGQMMQIITAGVDHLPLDQFPDDLVLQSNAGAYSRPIAEHVLALLLALSKRLRIEHRKMQEGEFDQFEPNHRIEGMTCGIFGYGGIGQESARLLKRLGVSVLGINRSGEAEEPADFVGTPEDLEDVLEQSTALVVTAALTPETRDVIDKEMLELLPEDGMIVNVARGEIIDQNDLYEHLTENPRFQAGIDAWWIEPVRHGRFEVDHPFLDLPNVIGSPHNSGQVPGVRNDGLEYAVDLVDTALTQGEYTNVVDWERGY